MHLFKRFGLGSFYSRPKTIFTFIRYLNCNKKNKKIKERPRAKTHVLSPSSPNFPSDRDKR